MSASSARSLPGTPLALLGAHPTLTLFDRAEPARCLTLRLVRRGADFIALADDGAQLVDRLRLGLRPAFFGQVDGVLLEGDLEVGVRGRAGAVPELALEGLASPMASRDAVVLDVVVKSAAPVENDLTLRSIPRT